MAIPLSTIVTKARILLNDTTGVRWDDAEMLLWGNEGRREMAHLKPAVFGQGTKVTHTLASGCYQTISTAGAYKIDSINANITSGKAIRPTQKAQLDAFKPAWRNDTAADVQNWFSDETNPLGFWVYPGPATVGATLEAHVHITPTDLTDPTIQMALPFDQYEPALVNYLCYRALSKDAEYAGNAAAAQAYYQLFTSALAPSA